MPDWREVIRARLAAAALGPADEAAIVDEMQAHLDDRYAELLGTGLTPAEGRRRTLDELGDGDLLARLVRGVVDAPRPPGAPLGADRRGSGLGGLVAGLWSDLRWGARLLRRTPGFTLVAALTLGLGIGANTAIFTIIDAMLLRPLPGLADPDRLVLLGRTQDGQGFDTFSYPDFQEYQRAARTLSGVAAQRSIAAHLSTSGASERVAALMVSGDWFRVLGVRPARGRLLLPDDDGAPGAHPVVVLGYGLWERRFASDPAVVGSVIRLDGHPFTIVGVAQRGFHGASLTDAPDLFVPLTMAGQMMPDTPLLFARHDAVWIELLGRLAPGATVAQAQTDLGAIAARLRESFPKENEGRGIRVAGGVGLDPGTRRDVGRFSIILQGVVALVLLIACANVANLLLARGAAREREFAVRASLGASRGRLVRQLLAEGVLLSVLGGVAGLGLGLLTMRLLIRLPVFANFFAAAALSPDIRVLAYTAAVALGSALLFSVPPAFRASRPELVPALRTGTPGSGAGRSRLRSGLLVVQLALSMVLLVVAGLLVRTMAALYMVPVGYATDRVLVATLDVGLQGYDEARGHQFFADVEQRAAALPGVRGAALGYMLPLGGGGWDTRLYAAGRPAGPDDPGLRTDINIVTPAYFATLAMPILRGRGFTDADRAGAPQVAVVNDALAKALWPGEDAVGRKYRDGRDGPLIEVIGVVSTAKYRSLLEAPLPFLYLPFAQHYQSEMTLHLNVREPDPRALIPALRRVVSGLDADLPIFRVQTLGDRLDRSVSTQRTAADIIGGYGLLALLMTAVGLYGAMAYLVSRRTHEIGIRMALGARSSAVMGRVLRDALRLAALGTALGLAASIPAARVVRSQLYGVTPSDPATLSLVIVLLLAVATLAAMVPARRATRVDPVEALRSE